MTSQESRKMLQYRLGLLYFLAELRCKLDDTQASDQAKSDCMNALAELVPLELATTKLTNVIS